MLEVIVREQTAQARPENRLFVRKAQTKLAAKRSTPEQAKKM